MILLSLLVLNGFMGRSILGRDLFIRTIGRHSNEKVVVDYLKNKDLKRIIRFCTEKTTFNESSNYSIAAAHILVGVLCSKATTTRIMNHKFKDITGSKKSFTTPIEIPGTIRFGS